MTNKKINKLAAIIQNDYCVRYDRAGAHYGHLTDYINREYANCELAKEICGCIHKMNNHFTNDIYLFADKSGLQINVRTVLNNVIIQDCKTYNFEWAGI